MDSGTRGGPYYARRFRTVELNNPSRTYRAVALCNSRGGRVRPDLVNTASFVYIRMHAGEGPGGGFTAEQLAYWSGRLRALGKAGNDRFGRPGLARFAPDHG